MYDAVFGCSKVACNIHHAKADYYCEVAVAAAVKQDDPITRDVKPQDMMTDRL